MKKFYGSYVGVFAICSIFLVPRHGRAFDENSPQEEEHVKLCYIPGIEGGTPYSQQLVPAELMKRGIDMLSFNNGGFGSVQQRANKFAKLLERELKKDPQLKCHLISYSMGGLIGRYAIKHLTIKHPIEGEIPLAKVIKSQMSVASPHRGTPIARLLKSFVGSADPALDQLTEEAVVAFNDEKFSDTFSPVVEGVPFFSFRTYLRADHANAPLLDRVGYGLLSKDLQKRNLHPANDGVVPTQSQSFGVWLGDLNLAHSFFTMDEGVRPSSADFFEVYWNFLQSKELSADAYMSFSSKDWSSMWHGHFEKLAEKWRLFHLINDPE